MSKTTLINIYEYIINEKYETESIIQSTYSSHISHIKRLRNESLFNKDIKSITINDIKQYLRDIANKYRNEELAKKWRILNSIFKYAYDNRIIDENLMTYFNKPKSIYQDKEKFDFLSIDEQRKLTSYLLNLTLQDELYKDFILLQLYTGIKPCELLALGYDDIDIKQNLITVHNVISKNIQGKAILIQMGKKHHLSRKVYLPTFLCTSLKEILERYEKTKENLYKNDELPDECKKLIFLRQSLYRHSKFKKIYKIVPEWAEIIKHTNKIAVKLNLEHKNITNTLLRNTYIARMFDSNLSIVAIQNILGYKKIDDILELYEKYKSQTKQDDLIQSTEYFKKNNIIYKEQ